MVGQTNRAPRIDEPYEISRVFTGVTRFEPRDDVHSILITGGAGFIGSWVTRHLTCQYPHYKIVCFDKLDDVASINNVAALKLLPNFHFVKADITDLRAVTNALRDFDVDCVMHFAASSHVQNSFDDSFSFTKNNIIGTQVVLEAVKRYGKVNRFVHVSTDEVYGSAYGATFDETAQFVPTNPYSASKGGAEMFVSAYAKSFKIPTITVRSNNVYGPHQYPEKIIPTFIKLLMDSKPLTLQGNGLNSRRYLYGADAADAFDTVLHQGIIGEVYNVSSQAEVTNLEVAKRLLASFGYNSSQNFEENVVFVPDRPFNDLDYRVDDTKLRELGWTQRTGFEDGLRQTINWYRHFGDYWWPRVSKLEASSNKGMSGVASPNAESIPETPPPQYQTPECIDDVETLNQISLAVGILAEKSRKAVEEAQEINV